MYRSALTRLAPLATLLLAACGEVKSGDAPDAAAADDGPPPLAVDAAAGLSDAADDAAPDAATSGPADATVPCQWTPPLALLRAPDNSGISTGPAVVAGQLTMYYGNQVREPVALTATRTSVEGDWRAGGTVVTGNFAVQDVSADGAELILTNLATGGLVAAVKDPTTGRFGTPTAAGVTATAVSIAPDRKTLYVLGSGEVKASTRASNGSWPAAVRVLSWTDLDISAVDVGPDGETLLLTGPDGAAISRRSGGRWSSPAPLRGLASAMASGELVADDLIYFDAETPGAGRTLYYSRCVVPR